MAGVTIKVKLESTAGTGHYYTTVKNPRNNPEKLELKKYDPVVRKHVIYKEKKLNSIREAHPKAPARDGSAII